MPGRVLVGFEAGAGERGRQAAAAAVDGQVLAGPGPTRTVELARDADVRSAARRLADRPEVAFAEPDWIRRVDACAPTVCWQLQPRPGANVVEAHGHGHRGRGPDRGRGRHRRGHRGRRPGRAGRPALALHQHRLRVLAAGNTSRSARHQVQVR